MRLDTMLPFLLLYQLMVSCLVQQQHLKSALNLSSYLMYSHSWEKLPRVDIVWEENIPNSLKAMTREKRGKGTRRQIQPETKIPGNWKAFLWVDENNMELVCFSGSTVHTNPHWWQSCLNLGHTDHTINIPWWKI